LRKELELLAVEPLNRLIEKEHPVDNPVFEFSKMTSKGKDQKTEKKVPKKDPPNASSLLDRTGDDDFESLETDTKTDTISTMKLLRNKLTRAKGGKFGTIRSRFTYKYAVNSTAGANLAVATAVGPASVSEWTALQALYDEVIIHGGEIRFFTSFDTGNGVPAMGVISFDPLNSGVYASVAAQCDASQHLLFRMDTTASTNTNTTSVPVSHATHGLWSFRWKIPTLKSARATSAGTVVSGEWSATTDSSSTYGFLKTFIENNAGGAKVYATGIVYLDMSLRSRS